MDPEFLLSTASNVLGQMATLVAQMKVKDARIRALEEENEKLRAKKPKVEA